MATQSGFENLVEMFEHSVKQYGPRDLFGTKKGGTWVWTTYAETGKLVDRFRAGLASLGIQKGDKICIVANNRVEWAVACYACFGLGAALVPMYEAQLPKEWAFIAADCGAVALIAATPEIVTKWNDVAEKAPTVKRIISLAGGKDDEGSFEWVLAQGDKAPVPSIQPSPKDVATLIYTSGTTGNPKGVILSHGNIVSNINAMQTLLQLGGDDRSLSFLPWAHSFGNTVELHGMTSKGASMALCPDTAGLIADLADVKPTVLMSVPRIFNKIYDGVNKQIAAKPALVQNLFKGGLKAATKQRKGEKLGLVEKATLAAADKLVFGTVREKFGGRLKYAFSGGSALSRDVAEFIDGLGITVYEGYGLTETSPIATANRPGAHRIGSVGQPIPDVKIVIDKAASGDPKARRDPRLRAERDAGLPRARRGKIRPYSPTTAASARATSATSTTTASSTSPAASRSSTSSRTANTSRPPRSKSSSSSRRSSRMRWSTATTASSTWRSSCPTWTRSRSGRATPASPAATTSSCRTPR